MKKDIITNRIETTVPWPRRLVAGHSPRRSGFAPFSIHLGFVVDRMALGQVSLRGLRLSVPVSFLRYSPYSLSSGDVTEASWWPQIRDIVSLHRHELQQQARNSMCSSIKYVERIPVVLSQCEQTGNSRSTFLPYDAALKNCSYINCKCPVQIPTLGGGG
jgi:hypothetical protein